MPLVDAERRAAFWAGWLRGDSSKPGEKLLKMVEVCSGYVHLTFNYPSMVSCLSIHGFDFFRAIFAFLKARYPAPKFVGPDGAAIPSPKGSNVELFNHWFEKMYSFEDKHMDYQKDYCECVDASRASIFSMLFLLNPQNIQAIFITTIKANAGISQSFTS